MADDPIGPWEAPPDDVAEQEQEVVPDPDEDDWMPDEDDLPMEANPADVSEQLTVVDIDDEN